MKALRILSAMLALILVVGLAASCAAPATEAPPEAPAATEAPAPTEPPAEPFEPLVISAPCEANKMKEIAALDEMTVQFTMCKPDPAFLAKAAFTPFYIQPQEWIEEKAGTTELLEHPVGTAPYYIDAWNRGDSVVFKRFDDYWGEPAVAETLVFRWATEGAARLLELQAGTVDHIVKLSPDDYDVVKGDANLQFLPVPNPNIMYLAMTNTFEPWGDVNVRKAIAMGIDRQRIVDNFYPAGSVAASHFTPCSIPNACQGEEWYEFDPEAARALLAEAGYPDGFETSIFYRDVFRVYLPEPGLVAVEIQSQLKENLGIEAEVVVMESGEFIAESTEGNLDGLYMLGWGADYLHVTNFLDFHFSRSNPQYGDPYPEIYEILEEASTIADEAVTAPMYTDANNAIKELIPCVPIAHGAPADAALADVEGAHTAVLGPPSLWKVNPGGRDTLIYLKAAEPISLYCMDETDGESLDGCKMVTEGLYKYDEFGTAQPTLATSCEANEDSTVWTCYLREGVKFHDGSTLDANDVVRSWEAGMNAASEYHIGNTGAFEYPSYLFDALMNAE
jgi:ABC-type transport system substrate-binding protein